MGLNAQPILRLYGDRVYCGKRLNEGFDKAPGHV